MATYIPNLTDVFPEPSLYQPDFNFFDKMLQRKQAQYDQGAARAMSARDMVRNAPVTDAANIELKGQYLKDADNALKTLSSADFSLPQNVNSAMNIYSPFWEDEMLMEDMKKSKINYQALNTLYAMRDSKDEKVRSQYNGIAVQYVLNDLEKLRNANRNPEAYKQVEGRRAIPFTNIEQYLDDEAAKEPDKLKIVWDDPAGPALYKMTNGEKVKKNFSVWAQSKLGNNFYEQFNVTGIVAAEEEAKIIKRLNPQATEEQINQEIARRNVSSLKEGYTNRIKDIEVEISKLDNLISKIPANFPASDKAMYQSLIDQKKQLVNYKEGIDLEYKGFDQKAEDALLARVMESPQKYYATLAKQRVIDGWATGRASIASREIKTNDPYIKAIELENERANLRRQEFEAQTGRINAETSRINALKPNKSITTKVGPNGEVITEEQPSPREDTDTGGQFVGRTTTDVLKNPGSAYQRFLDNQRGLKNSFNNIMLDPQGVLFFAKELGLNQREKSLISTGFKESLNNGTIKFTSPNDKKEFDNATTKLITALNNDPEVKALGFTDSTKVGPERMMMMLSKYAESTLTKRGELAKNGTDLPLTDEETRAIISHMTAKSMIETYSTNEKNREELVQKNLVGNKEFERVVVDRDGKKDLISVSDLAKDMPSATLVNTKTGEVLNYTKEDIASLFMTGNIGNTVAGQLTIGDNSYYIKKVNGKEDSWGKPLLHEWSNLFNDDGVLVGGPPGSITKKYGTSKQFKEVITKANDNIVPNLLFYQKQGGAIGSTFNYAFDYKQDSENAAEKIFQEVLQPANIIGFFEETTDGKLDPLNTNDQSLLRNLFTSKRKNIENYVQGFTFETIGVEGKPTVSFSITSVAKSDEVGDTKLSAYEGRKFRLQLSPNAEGPIMQGLPSPSSQFVFSKLLRGESLEADPIMKAAGFEYTIDPDNVNSPSKLFVNGSFNRRSIVNQNGELKMKIDKVPIANVSYDLTGTLGKSPDQIMNNIMSTFLSVIKENADVVKTFNKMLEAQKNNGGSPTAVSTSADLQY
jgi:hypothetical protein